MAKLRGGLSAVSVLVFVWSVSGALCDGMKGGGVMLPQVAGEIRSICKTRFPTDQVDRDDCERKNSLGYWRILGIVEWLDGVVKDEPHGIRMASDKLIASCFDRWSNSIGREYYQINRCIEREIKKITGKEPIYTDRKNADIE